MSPLVAAAPYISPRVLDRLEQAVVLILYSFLARRLWPDEWSLQTMFASMLLISEGAVAVFLLLRRPTDNISFRLGDWAIAAAGSFLVLLVGTGGAPISPVAGACLLIGGSAIHIGAKLSLNFSFGLVAANRGVKRDGMYRFVRHPMYAGYMLTHVGYLLLQPSLWNLCLYATTWMLFILRIGAEERVLSRDPAYRAFSKDVRYRLLPGVY